ncbi:GGDEF domain-containing protein [Chitinilyticum aquatile]|uniref:GGDEF domain-containing protein n=1 Tax=Chitinilyticum aquatile TaxID=362520 RepID=UPI0004123EB3|nr:GGDEF domain-containing protein [Chitinilyticum aquatile]
MMLQQLQDELDHAPEQTRLAALALARRAEEQKEHVTALQARLLAAKALGRQDYQSSLAELQKLLLPLRHAGLYPDLMEALDEAGGHAMVLGDINLAVQYWSDCLDHALDRRHGSFAVRALNGIGKVFWVLNDHVTAHHYHCTALDFALPLDDTISLSAVYLCLCTDLIALQRHTVAGIALKIAHPYVSHCGNRHWQAEYQLHCGTVLAAEGDHLAAAQSLHQAERMAEELGFRWVLSQAAFQLHLLALTSHEDELARQQLERAVALAAAIEAHTLLEQIHFHAYCHYKAAGHLQSALAHYRAYLGHYEHNHQTTAPRLARHTERRLRRLQGRIELAQRTLENDLLNNTLRVQHEQLDTLGRAAITDPLTGLFNRRMLEQQFEHYDRQPVLPMTLLLADMDHFKEINDHYGHQAGDRVLQALAQLLRQACRGSELIARYGGEEFVILLPLIGLEQGRRIAERLRNLVATHDWQGITPGLNPTISIGLAATRNTSLAMPALARMADTALYAAKAAGRNCVRWQQAG